MERLSFIEAANVPKGIKAFTTTRYGGYSQGPYKSFNLGYFTEDDTKAVTKNYKLLENLTAITSLVFLKQEHGNEIKEVTFRNAPDIHLSSGDGFFTTEYGVALGILTADCFPVLLAGEKCLAALHCGWRGLNSGIIEKAADMFIKKEDFPSYAYIGPGICKNCYQVREDMISVLNPQYEPREALFKTGEGTWKLDLKKLVLKALEKAGVRNVSVSDFSSCCSDGFFSYRRDKGVTGRMLTVISRRK